MVEEDILLHYQNIFINERKSEQAHIPHAPTLLENAVYDKWQFQALGTGNRKKRGYKLLLKKINQHFL